MKFFDNTKVPIEEYEKIEKALIKEISDIISCASMEEKKSFFNVFKKDHYYNNNPIEQAVTFLSNIHPAIKVQQNSLLTSAYKLANLTSGNKDSLVRFGETHEMNIAHLYNNEGAVEKIHTQSIGVIGDFLSNLSE